MHFKRGKDTSSDGGRGPEQIGRKKAVRNVPES